MDHLSLNSHTFAMNDSDAGETGFVCLMQVLLDNPLYVARWNRVKVKDICNRNFYGNGEWIKGINVNVNRVFNR